MNVVRHVQQQARRPRRPRTRRARGYLLIDVMVGGAMAAVVIGILLTVLASARAKNVAATRDVVATQLVLEEIDKQRAVPAASFASLPVATPAIVSTTSGAYNRTAVQVAAGNESIGNSGAGCTPCSFPFKDIRVRVTYTSEGKLRTSQATTRIYQ